jgi:hypothetical protein
MSYRRVLPRDLFNEAKLLKCLGQLALLLHDYPYLYPLRLEHEAPEEGFKIDQMPDDGCLCCSNLTLYNSDDDPIELSSSYNSRGPYPLWAYLNNDWVHVFDDNGNFANEFLRLIGG